MSDENKNYGPKIVIGLVGGIGANLDDLKTELDLSFKRFAYKKVNIKISDFFDEIIIDPKIFKEQVKKSECPDLKLTDQYEKSDYQNYHKKITLGNTLREYTGDDSILARLAIDKIYNSTFDLKGVAKENQLYIIDQIKTMGEYKLLRKVYGRSFFLIGAFEDRSKRRKRLENKLGNDNKSEENSICLIKRDQNENVDYGQKLSKVFPESHIFIDVGNIDLMKSQVKRFVNIVFNYPHHTPSVDESCMFLAKGTALRSADLGRQVGAVIANKDGDIISIGWNDVPKVGGGLYFEGDTSDLRDFQLGYDSNKKEINDIKCKIKKHGREPEKLNDVLKEELSDLLEFGRSVHAEQAAICDAARRGVSLLNATLYCTTFPCHMCAKHIMAVGIKRVVYIDPYPKSKAKELFGDSISISNSECDCNKLVFEHFIGVAPRRFLHLFGRSSERELRDDDGKLKPWQNEDEKENFISHLKNRNYAEFIVRELAVIESLNKQGSKGFKCKINGIELETSKIKSFFKKLDCYCSYPVKNGKDEK